MKRREVMALLLTLGLTASFGVTDIFHATIIPAEQETQISTEVEMEDGAKSETNIDITDTQVYYEEEDDEPDEMTFSDLTPDMDLRAVAADGAYDIDDVSSGNAIAAAHKKIIAFTNQTVLGYRCSATAAMTIVGNDLYCVRTASQTETTERKLPVVLHIIKNFATNPVEQIVIIQTESGSQRIAAHANGISHTTDASGNITFYLATGNAPDTSEFDDEESIKGSQVVCFGTDGKIFKKYSYSQKAYSVNYFKTESGVKYFLLNRGTSGTGCYRFALVKENGTTLEHVKNYKFRVLKDQVGGVDTHLYNSGNDASYDPETKRMYLTLFLKESDNSITKNAIVRYDMSTEQTIYDPVRVIQTNASGEVKFEIEGVGVSNSKTYICANVVTTSGVEGPDAIYSIYKTGSYVK